MERFNKVKEEYAGQIKKQQKKEKQRLNEIIDWEK
jgi:hypothetical protein